MSKKRMNENTIQKKAEYYQNKKQDVHVKVVSGFFYNGPIKSISKDHLVLQDRRFFEVVIFFSEILDIVPYEVRK